MKFVRRPDLDPQTRIPMVMLAWLHHGIYGKMTHIAQYYRISRTFLSQLLFVAHLQLEMLFSEEKLHWQQDQRHVAQLIVLLRLEGKCSIPSISSIVTHLGYQPHSVGSLSACFQRYGRALPSTLSRASTTVVFYRSDEMFACHAPILVTIDAQSTTILKIELAADRSAETWRAHFTALDAYLFHSLGMASDRGVGLVAGYHATCEEALWVCDYFHEFQDLFTLLHQLERKAYAAIRQADETAQKFAHAKSESNLHQRLHQYAQVHQACEHAMALYDQLDMRLHLLRETLQLCSSQGKRRTVEGVRAELTSLLDMIEEIDWTAIIKTLQPIKAHIDDMLVPFAQCDVMYAQLLEVVPAHALDFLVLAWHHDHCSYQSRAKQKCYHQSEREAWLACAEGLLDKEFARLKTLVFEKLDSIIRASSLVEMVTALIRPSLHSCKGQISQEALNLMMFYHNHRRYKSGKRKGKAPIELLTGEALEADWVEL